MYVRMGVPGENVISSGNGLDNVSDVNGRFTLTNAPIGMIQLRGFPKDNTSSEYSSISIVRHVDGNGTIDLGDTSVVKSRMKPGDIAGELGLHWWPAPLARRRNKLRSALRGQLGRSRARRRS
jgi:hypothetical protein